MKKVVSLFLAISVFALTFPLVSLSAMAAEASVVLYNMSVGSRPASIGVTSRMAHAKFATLADDDQGDVIQYQRVIGSTNIQDQGAYFDIGAANYTKYGKPTKLTFKVKTDTGAIVFNNRVYLHSAASAASSTSVLSVWSFSSTWKTYTIDLTSGEGLKAVNEGRAFLTFNNQKQSQNTANYFYIDDVTLYYEAPAGHKVTVDGVETEVNDGENFTFAAASGVAFYTDGTNYYTPGESVVVDKDLTFTSIKINAQMKLGAAMRLKTVSGLRFYTQINSSQINDLRNLGATVELGTLIAPKDLIADGELTLDLEDAAIVPYTAAEYFEENTFVGSVVNIKDANANREFVGRGFVTVSIAGKTSTVYADYTDSNINNNSRALSWVATQVQSSDEYATLSVEHKAFVDKYAAMLVG